MSDNDQAAANIQTVRDEILALHKRMVVDQGMDQMDFYNALVNYAAWYGTALMPMGLERRAIKAMSESFSQQIKGWLADPEVKASRALALGGPSTTH